MLFIPLPNQRNVIACQLSRVVLCNLQHSASGYAQLNRDISRSVDAKKVHTWTVDSVAIYEMMVNRSVP